MYDIIIIKLLFSPEMPLTVREWPSFREEQSGAPRRGGFIRQRWGWRKEPGGRVDASGLMEEQEALQKDLEEE